MATNSCAVRHLLRILQRLPEPGLPRCKCRTIAEEVRGHCYKPHGRECIVIGLLLCRIGLHRWEDAIFVLPCRCIDIPGRMCQRCAAERPEWEHEHRVPVSLFDRVEGCFVCTHPKGLPIPMGEVDAADDLALCGRHWSWWVTRWVNSDDEPPCSAHLLTTHTDGTHDA